MKQEPLRSKPGNMIQTIERVALILDMVAQSSQGASIRDLSAGLKLPKGTVHRILSSLSYFGYIRQDMETKNYFLGFTLMDLGSRLTNQLDLRKIAAPVLKKLADRTKETVHMVVLDRGEIVYIDKVETDADAGGLKMSSRVGSRNAVHSCAVGKVLLAYLEDEDIAEIIADKGLAPKTVNTITDPALLKEHLKGIRTQGHAIDDEENERGIRCVAAPIFDGQGHALAAASISGPAFRITKKIIQDVLKKEVMAAASEVSGRLGFSGQRPPASAG